MRHGRRISAVGAVVALLAGACGAYARPPAGLRLALPAPAFHPAAAATGPAALRALVVRPWSLRPRLPWRAARRQRLPIAPPTLLPTAAVPLAWDMTPPVPCPAGEHRVWQSFGAMPGADLVIAGMSGFRPDSLCAPVGRH